MRHRFSQASLALALTSAAGIGACSLATSFDGLVARAGDAGTSVDAGDGGVDAGAPTSQDAATDAATVAQDASVSAYAAAVLSDGPVAYYRLGDTGSIAKDIAGGHDGTHEGTLSLGPGAIVGDSDMAIVDDGQGWIDIGKVYSFLGTASYSLEAWIAPTTSSTLTGVVARNLGTPTVTPSDGYSLYVNTDLTPTMGRWLSSAEDSVSASALPQAAFTYIVGTYDGATLRIYINGALANSAPSSKSIIDPGVDLMIAATRNGSFGYFYGSIDEVAIYDKALAPARIAAHFATGSGK